jgi:uncharacterized membrane protein
VNRADEADEADEAANADHAAKAASAASSATEPRTLPSSGNSRRDDVPMRDSEPESTSTFASDLAAIGAPGRVAGRRFAALGAFAMLAALTLLCVAWEWRLAPLRPGGSALVLKALPLACALPGVLRRRLYTLQWASMLVLLYFAEGIVRGMTDRAPGNLLGWVEVALSTGFFACALAYVAPYKRAARRAKRGAQ